MVLKMIGFNIFCYRYIVMYNMQRHRERDIEHVSTWKLCRSILTSDASGSQWIFQIQCIDDSSTTKSMSSKRLIYFSETLNLNFIQHQTQAVFVQKTRVDAAWLRTAEDSLLATPKHFAAYGGVSAGWIITQLQLLEENKKHHIQLYNHSCCWFHHANI